MLNRIQKFQSEIVTAGSELADGTADQVIRDNRGNRSGQSGGGGNKRFRNSWSDGAQGGRSRSAQSVKGIDNTPDCSEQTNKWCHGRRDRQPRHVTLQPGYLFRSADLPPELHRKRT